MLVRPIDLRAFLQQQSAPRRRGPLWQAMNSGVRPSSSAGRPPRRCPATAAPRQRGRSRRRCTAAYDRSDSPDRPPRPSPAAAAPRRRGVKAGDVQRRTAAVPRTLTSAPFSSTSRAASMALWQAKNNGVSPSSFVARSTSAPLSSNRRVTSTRASHAGDDQRRHSVLRRPINVGTLFQNVGVADESESRRVHLPGRPRRLCPATASVSGDGWRASRCVPLA